MDASSQSRTSSLPAYRELVEKGHRVAETLTRFCAKVVFEHQYLTQGWNAVTSNLDENVSQISTRYTKSYRICQRLPLIKKRAKAWVTDFDTVFKALHRVSLVLTWHSLSQIKVPGYLLTASSSSSDKPEPISLYDWISRQDAECTLEELVEHVAEHVDKLDDLTLQVAGGDLKLVKDFIKRTDYREIRGIAKRMTTLDSKLAEIEANLHKFKEFFAADLQQPDRVSGPFPRALFR